MKKIILTLSMLAVTVSATFAQTNSTPVTNMSNSLNTPVTPSSTPQNTSTTTTTTATLPAPGDFKFTEEAYDFGSIPQGIEMSHDFEFTNDGSSPITISDVQISMGSAIVDWPKKAIEPGKKGVITVTYTANSTGIFSITLTVISNGKSPVKTIRIRGNVSSASNNSRFSTGNSMNDPGSPIKH